MAKKKTEDKISLDAILFKCRDILRQARNSGSFFEKRDMMLTLVFLRFIGEQYPSSCSCKTSSFPASVRANLFLLTLNVYGLLCNMYISSSVKP